MAPQKMTAYEKKRLDNIRRNGEQMASLNIYSALSQLSAATKPLRRVSSSNKTKKPKTDSPATIRRSLRKPAETGTGTVSLSRKTGKLSFRDAHVGNGSDRALIDTILSLENKPQVGVSIKKESEEQSDKPQVGVSIKKESEEQGDGISNDSVKGVVKSEYLDCGESKGCFDLTLKEENVVRVCELGISAVKFLPCNDIRMIIVGNTIGNVLFWNLNSEEDDEDDIYEYRQHTGPISGISVQQSCLSKIFTSSCHGSLRLMNTEKQVFDLVYSSKEPIFSLSQRPCDMNGLYFGRGHGRLVIWDERMSKQSSLLKLHKSSINSIDFNAQNPNIMATSSADGTACIWDIRCINPDEPKQLNIITHEKAVNSAYFSPSGSYLATTSADDTIGVLKCPNFEETCRIYHDNKNTAFRGIWGWDDSHIFIGNERRGVDVISCLEKRTMVTLKSPHITSIPFKFDAHPYCAGTLAGATRFGRIYLWTPKDELL